jgi:hypothetical protein
LQGALRVSRKRTSTRTGDATHKNPNIICNKCGKKGHIGRNCPNQKKVNELDIEEISEEESGEDWEDEEVEVEEKRAR